MLSSFIGLNLIFAVRMKIIFKKYQGTGNDFIMIDNLNGLYDDLSIKQIAFACDRKMGIGGDGLIKISSINGFDFEVEYYNSDGSQSFCGNGARCSVAFAKELGVITNDTRFLAIDGEHKASCVDGSVRLEMLPVEKIEEVGDDFFLDTGSPHYVHFSKNEKIDIVSFGKKVRYSEKYKIAGVNVNVVNKGPDNSISVLTYERGVENETLSCGTGVTACALVYMKNKNDFNILEVNTKGGQLFVEATFNEITGGFNDIWLTGPALKVYEGSIDV